MRMPSSNLVEQLLVKKRAIKQGAMQQLLTGKTRLPGFSGEWETKKHLPISRQKAMHGDERLDRRISYRERFSDGLQTEHLGILHST